MPITIKARSRLASAAAETVLGIDPGLQRTGYAAIAPGNGTFEGRLIEAGVIRLNPREPLEQRLCNLDTCLSELFDLTQPGALACEELYAHYRHPRTAILMGHARGVILAAAARRGVPVLNLAATHVKKMLTGSGRAGKAQIQRAIAATLNLPTIPEPNDVADAMAIALCGLRTRVQSQPNDQTPPPGGR